jgi:hypothetical protein
VELVGSDVRRLVLTLTLTSTSQVLREHKEIQMLDSEFCSDLFELELDEI